MKRQCFLLGFLFLFVNSSLFAAEPDQLYQKGLQAYNAEDYLSASEHLFAYRQMAGAGLSADFLRQVNEALVYAEDQVQVAIETKRELDEHGRVTEITVEASGKADEFGTSRKKTKPFHPPSGVKGPRPSLPSKPKITQGDKFKIGKVVAPEPKFTVQPEVIKPEMKDETVTIKKELERVKLENARLVQSLKKCQMDKQP